MNFSLYRGRLHKVPDVPRRWPLSKPSMSLQTFKKALAKRQEALDLLQRLDPSVRTSPEAAPAESSGHANMVGELDEPFCEKGADFMEEDLDKANRILVDNDLQDSEVVIIGDEDCRRKARDKRKREDIDVCANDASKLDGPGDECKEGYEKGRDSKNLRRGFIGEYGTNMEVAEAIHVDGDERFDEMDCDQDMSRNAKPSKQLEVALSVEKQMDVPYATDVKGRPKGGDAVTSVASQEEYGSRNKAQMLETPSVQMAMNGEDTRRSDQGALQANNGGTPEVTSTADARYSNQKSKRKAELEAKLKELKETKHQLVQMLKQVLSTEEESKKRGQGLTQSPATISEALTCAAQPEHRHGLELEEGELEHTRSHGCHTSLGASPSTCVFHGRQSSISQQSNQSSRQREDRHGAR
eukprot:c21000_g2_i1 orf=517-1752(+)